MTSNQTRQPTLPASRNGQQAALAQRAAVIIPPLYCPITPAVNPHVERTHEHSMQWVAKFHLVQPQSKQHDGLQAGQFAWLAALTQPYVSLEDLQLYCDSITWLTLHDDILDTSQLGRNPQAWGMLERRLSAILQGAAPSHQDEPLVSALSDLCQRLRRRTSEAWMERFAISVKQSFQANLWEATNRAHGITPDLTTYTKLRQFSDGFSTCFDLIGMMALIDPQADFLTHLYVQQLEVMAINHCVWVNDIFSYKKEMMEANGSNLVLVLQNECQLGLQAAVNRAVAMCDAEMRAFLRMASNLPSFGPAEDAMLARYLHCLQACMRGHLDWYAKTTRYQVIDGQIQSLVA
ncbi:MAG TPA: hypothetical protein PKE45_00170 [Caldilineaceae bacterium]|nr:hypothetical protein [Caldilineaceae bacterium]